VAIKVLEDEVAKVSCFVVLLEFDLNVRLTRTLCLRVDLVRHVAFGLNDCKAVVFLGQKVAESAG